MYTHVYKIIRVERPFNETVLILLISSNLCFNWGAALGIRNLYLYNWEAALERRNLVPKGTV